MRPGNSSAKIVELVQIPAQRIRTGIRGARFEFRRRELLAILLQRRYLSSCTIELAVKVLEFTGQRANRGDCRPFAIRSTAIIDAEVVQEAETTLGINTDPLDLRLSQDDRRRNRLNGTFWFVITLASADNQSFSVDYDAHGRAAILPEDVACVRECR